MQLFRPSRNPRDTSRLTDVSALPCTEAGFRPGHSCNYASQLVASMSMAIITCETSLVDTTRDAVDGYFVPLRVLSASTAF